MIGLNFVGQYNNLEQKATVKDWTDEGKFIVEFVDGGEILTTYNDIINKSNQKDKEGSDLYAFTDLIDHRNQGNQYIVQVKCDNGKTTWEPMKLIKKCDPHTLAKYTHEKNTVRISHLKSCILCMNNQYGS